MAWKNLAILFWSVLHPVCRGGAEHGTARVERSLSVGLTLPSTVESGRRPALVGLIERGVYGLILVYRQEAFVFVAGTDWLLWYKEDQERTVWTGPGIADSGTYISSCHNYRVSAVTDAQNLARTKGIEDQPAWFSTICRAP
jgi:hypothetical protein